MHPNPAVAIIVPTLNRPHTLPICLQSIRAQTLDDWVCIVINQGEPIERPKDVRFMYVDRSQKSASLARNMGLSLALCLKAEYVCLLDDDDRIEPTYMEEMAGDFESHTAAFVIVACNGTYDGQTYPHDHASTKLVGSRMVRASAIGDRCFEARSGQEKHFWRSFDGEPQIHIDKVLYHASRDPVGGLRDDGGSY